MAKSLPNIDYLRDLFSYDPKTGVLTWRERPVEHFTTERAWKAWNTKYSGTKAGSVGGSKYRKIRIDGRRYNAHRVVYAIHHGNWPQRHIDHIDGDGDNNKIANLRDVDRQTNQRNAGMRTDNTSGVTGVGWDKSSRKWRAYITLGGQYKHVGLFENVEDATAARKAAAREHGFTDRHGEAS